MSSNDTKKDENDSSPNAKAGVYSTAFNLANIMLGVGALTLPRAFSQSGIISGLLLLGVLCVCSHYTSILVVKCADKVGVDSYEALTEKILGAPGYLFFCVLCAFTNIGAAIVYIMFIIECLQLQNSVLTLILLCTLTILPLCFVKDWESLSILSKIKTCVYGMVVLFVVVAPPFDDYTQSNIVRDWTEFVSDRRTWCSGNIFQSLGSFVFSVVYHDCIFPVKKTMQNQSVAAWSKVSRFTLMLVVIFSTILGIGGFINFRMNTQNMEWPDNVFNNKGDKSRLFSSEFIPFHIARYTLVGLMLMTVPLCIHVSRDYIDAIITKISEMVSTKNGAREDQQMMQRELEGGQKTSVSGSSLELEENNTANTNDGPSITVEIENIDAENESEQQQTNVACFMRFVRLFAMSPLEYLVTICSFAGSLFLAVLLSESSDIEDVINIVGDIALAGIAFILPAIIFFCTFKRSEYSAFTMICVVLILLWGMTFWLYEISAFWNKNFWRFEK